MQKMINLMMIPVVIFLFIHLSTITYGEIFSITPATEHNYNLIIPVMKYMRKCNITIEGNGYSCWLSGININNKTFISIAVVHLLEGKTQIYSIENPDERYTSSGEQLVFIRWYKGYHYSKGDSIPPSIIYNGTAMSVLIINL